MKLPKRRGDVSWWRRAVSVSSITAVGLCLLVGHAILASPGGSSRYEFDWRTGAKREIHSRAGRVYSVGDARDPLISRDDDYEPYWQGGDSARRAVGYELIGLMRSKASTSLSDSDLAVIADRVIEGYEEAWGEELVVRYRESGEGVEVYFTGDPEGAADVVVWP